MCTEMPWKYDDPFDLLSSWKSKKINKRKAELKLLVENWYISEEDISFAKSLIFSEQNIIDNYSDIKKIIKLLYNNFSYEFICFLDLKTIIRDNHWDMNSIKSELRKQISIEQPRIWYTVLLMSILDIRDDIK